MTTDAPPTPLAASGSYFGRPIAAFAPDSRWIHRHYNTVAIILAAASAVAGVVFLVQALTGPGYSKENATFFSVGLYIPVFCLGLVLFFFRLSYNAYVIDEHGFTTRGPLRYRRVVIDRRDIARVGVSSTGASLIGDFAELDEVDKARRGEVLAAVARSYKTDLFAESATGYVLVVETRAASVTGVYIGRTNAASLLAAVSTLEPR